MADDVDQRLQIALDTLLSVTEKNGKLRNDLKKDIFDSVSTLRMIFVNLKSSAAEHMDKITQLESEVKTVRAELQGSRAVNQLARFTPSMNRMGETPTSGTQHGLPPSGDTRRYSEVTRAGVQKRYRVLIKSKTSQPPETIINVLKTSINPTEMKVGIKAVKSLNDGRVLIEVGSIDETNTISSNIRDKCSGDLEVNVPKLRKPRIIIRNTPQDITVENLEETILAQNPNLSLKQGEIAAKFKFRTKRGDTNMVIEVGPETRNKLLQTKLKIGWLICSTGDYLVAKRCFRCSRYNHTHQTCRGQETCPLCAESHSLKDCKAPTNLHKCINCMTYNRYSKKEKINENHSSLSKDCPSLQFVLTKYRQNTDY
jgi:hypothetical protein